MKNIILYILLSIFTLNLFSSLYCQSFIVSDPVVTDFNEITAKFRVIDKNGNQLKYFSTEDFTIIENGVQKTIKRISCPAPEQPAPVSSVLILDASESMVDFLDWEKEAALTWINTLNLGRSECAVTGYNTKNFILRDFTTDRQSLLQSLDGLYADGGTDFDAAFSKPMAGGLLVAQKAKNKKVIIFLTDGRTEKEPHTAEIVEGARAQELTIYSIVLKKSAPKSLKLISSQTGGICFDHVSTKEELKGIYLQILKIVQEIEPCTMSWTSEAVCDSGQINAEINYLPYKLTYNIVYTNTYKDKIQLIFDPDYIYFFNKIPGIKHDTTLKISCFSNDISIVKITSSNPLFAVSPDNFSLEKGDTKSLTLSYTPVDSSYEFTELILHTDICDYKYYVAAGFIGREPDEITLHLISPNGGEYFPVGSDALITWECVSSRDTMLLEYSADKGLNWHYINGFATGLKYLWKDIPGPVSDQCLMRIKQIGFNSGSESVSDLLWEKSIGGSLSDEVTDLEIASDRGYIFVGSSASSDKDIPKNKGDKDILAAKLSENGNIQWIKNIGGSREDLADDVELTSDGGIVIIGNSYSSDFDLPASIGSSDVIITKINLDGEILWTKNFGGSMEDIGTGIRQTEDGGYIFCASTLSNDKDVSGGHGGYDFWIVKINDSGNIKWQRTLGGSSDDFATDICTNNSGGFAVAGWTRSGDGDIQTLKGNMDIWIINFDSNGKIKWNKTYGGSANEGASSIRVTNDGGFIISGLSHSSDIDLKKNNGKSDIWIIKTDSLGNLLWQQNYGGSNDDIGLSAEQTFDGGYVISGWTNSTDGDIDTNKGYGDYWIAKLDGYGKLIWQKTLGGRDEDVVASVKQTYDGGYIAAGRSRSTDGDIKNNIGDNDCWLVKLSPEKTILQSDSSDAVFSIVKPVATAADIDMGSVLTGRIKDSVIYDYIKNVGSWKFSVDTVYFTGNDASFFGIVNKEEFEIAAGSSASLELIFSPSRAGIHYADIIIITQSDTLKQKIQGEGVDPVLSVHSGILDFGEVVLGNERIISDTVLLKNTDPDPVSITNTKFLESGTKQFSIISGGGSFTLNSGDERKLTLRFKPVYGGRSSGRLGFEYSGTGSPATIDLFGTGKGGTVRITDNSAYAGDIVNFKLLLENILPRGLIAIADEFSADIKFPGTVLQPLDKSLISINKNDSLTLSVSGPLQKSNILSELSMIALPGNIMQTALEIHNFKLYKSGSETDYKLELVYGSFKLLDNYDEDSIKYINPAGVVRLLKLSPNPVCDKLEISVLLDENSFYELNIYNSPGEKVLTVFSGKAKDYGKKDFSINTKILAPGQYFVVLKTTAVIQTKKFMIVR